jgi:hypothetical protein
MRPVIRSPLLALCFVACATLPATARPVFLPAGVYGIYLDNDVGAVNQSAWAFASPANTRGNPIDAARAVIALEYLTGEVQMSPRWVKISHSVPVHLARARDEVRQILGIRPDTPPQLVVNALLALTQSLQMGDEPTALRVLGAPMFTRQPAQTLQDLSNLPYVQEANLSTSQLENEMLSSGLGN